MAKLASSRQHHRTPISDYALIGNCRSAALVSKSGSIDWLCTPRFDSPSVFAAMLDPECGGHFRIVPEGVVDVRRRYVPGTNVLETTFQTVRGVVRLTDLMPVTSEDAKSRRLWPSHEILRQVECVEGFCRVHLEYAPRPAYAKEKARLRWRGQLGVACEIPHGSLYLRSELPVRLDLDESVARAAWDLEAGDRTHIAMVLGDNEPAVLPALFDDAERRLEESVKWWRSWSGRCKYDGPHREAVVRSALTLKLLSFAPSGAIVAAPTTSLPEHLGGTRNWDYRYCWLRDASMTLESLLDLGYREEGQAFLSWLLYSTRLTAPDLQVVYDVHGQPNLNETDLGYLEGYAGSRPVRVGNEASNQVQLDTYGEVIHAVYEWVERGGTLDRTAARFVRGLADNVCVKWRQPDNGLWESRGGRRHFTVSKVLCWSALDRVVRMTK